MILLFRVVLFCLGALPAIAFPIVYHLSTRGAWRRYPVGRTTMLLASSLALLYLSGVLSLVLPPLVTLSIRIPVLLFLAVALWAQLWSLWRVQCRHREDTHS